MRSVKQVLTEKNLQANSCGKNAAVDLNLEMSRSTQRNAGRLSTKQASSTLLATDNNVERIKRLFLRLSVIYGHIWSSQFKNKDYLNLAKKEWSETLENIDGKALENAISECRTRYEMPPTLPQFYQLCSLHQRRLNLMLWEEGTKSFCDPKANETYQTHEIKNTQLEAEIKLREVKGEISHWEKYLQLAEKKGQHDQVERFQKFLDQSVKQYKQIKANYQIANA